MNRLASFLRSANLLSFALTFVLLLCGNRDLQAHGFHSNKADASALVEQLAAATPSLTEKSDRAALMATSFAPFKPKVRFYWDDTYFYEESDGFPNRALMPDLMVGITAWNQQVPLPTSYFASTPNGSMPNYWRIPLTPVPANVPYEISSTQFLRGAIALASNGIPIFNPANNTGQYSYNIGELDAYGGHSGMADDYHYHIAPTHLTAVLGNDKPLAWVLDGYPMYGYVEPDGSPMLPLDACGGHNHGPWGYHYHARGTLVSGTWRPSMPFMNSKFYGTVSYLNSQVDPQPLVTPIRNKRTDGVGYQPEPVGGSVVITAFMNPVALMTNASGDLQLDTTPGAVASDDCYLLRYTHNGTSYDQCWKFDRTNGTLQVTWRLPAGVKTSSTTYPITTVASTTTAVYPAATTTRIKSYSMAGRSMLSVSDTSQSIDTTATFGEDADYSLHWQSFTDNSNGTVTDNVTGLMWQKTDAGESTWDTAVAAAGTIRTGGYSDWRLPTPSELFSIFNHNNANPALDSAYFQNHPAGAAEYWWTSDPYGSSTTLVWCANSGGGLGGKPKSETLSAGGKFRYHARYVRGSKPTNGHNYFNHGDGTITDLDTNLMWTQVPGSPLTWEDALRYAESLTTAGYSDWRLPNIKELQTLTDYTLAKATSTAGMLPSLNGVLFPAATATAYWSSTSLKNSPSEAWLVEFGINTSVPAAKGPTRGSQGIISYEDKMSTYPVFAVRTTGVISQALVSVDGVQLVDNASTVSFSGVEYGQTLSRTFTVKNSGASSLRASGVSIDGANASSFQCGPFSSVFLASGSSATVEVSYVANEAGSKTAMLRIACDDPTLGGAFDIALSGKPTIAAPSVTNTWVVPAASSNLPGVLVNATVNAAPGAMITSVSGAYADGGQLAATVFGESMALTESLSQTGWNGSGTQQSWVVATEGPPDSFSQKIAANQGPGNPCGLKVEKCGSSLSANTLTCANAINASGISGFVEFRMATLDLAASDGWTFQVSTDGGATWNTKISELTGNNHESALYHYALASGELVSTLKIRFQFSGSNPLPPARPSKFYLDDVQVVVTSSKPALSFYLFDDGQHGDGNAGDGIYGALISEGTLRSGVSYTVSATDSNAGTSAAVGTLSTTSIALSSINQIVGSTGGTYSLGITSSERWTVSGLPAWASVSQSNGYSANIRVSVIENPSSASRSATLLFNNVAHTLTQGGNPSVVVTTPVEVTAVSFSQRTNGSKLVDIDYTLTGGSSSVSLGVSLDGGTTFTSVNTLSGDIGGVVPAGTGKRIVWNAGADYPNASFSNLKLRVAPLTGTGEVSSSGVVDTKPPVLTVPGAVSVNAVSESGAIVALSGASATDNFATPVVTYSPPSGSIFPIGSSAVTVTATDSFGNVATGTFLVTVNPLPKVTAVSFSQRTNGSKLVDIDYTLTGGSSSVSLGVSLDGGTTFISVNTLSGDVGGVVSAGTGKRIVWNAGADYPNASFSNLKVRVAPLTGTGEVSSSGVVDTKPPVLTVPGAVSVNALSESGAAVALSGASATDDFGAPVVTYSPPSGSTFPIGSSAVTVTATDSFGNMATGNFDVTVGRIPAVVKQPSAAITVLGGSVTFSVSAVGMEPLRYQWRKDGVNIDGEIAATLILKNLQNDSAGSYSVAVTNAFGGMTSAGALLYVGRGILILQEPLENLKLVRGTPVSLPLVVDSGVTEALQTTYKVVRLPLGQDAGISGVVPLNGQLQIPLNSLTSGGTFAVEFSRLYSDGDVRTGRSRDFALDVRTFDEAAGSYEVVLADVSPGLVGDGASARGVLRATVSRTGMVSGRVCYIEASPLSGAPASERVYTAVARAFAAVFVPSASDASKLVCAPRLGVGSQANRQSIQLELDFSGATVELNSEVRDHVSVPGEKVADMLRSQGLRAVRGITKLEAVPLASGSVNYASLATRYVLGSEFCSTPAGGAGADENAILLARVIPSSGRVLWTTRTAGVTGSGASTLSATIAGRAQSEIYQARTVSNAAAHFTTSLLGRLHFEHLEDGSVWSASVTTTSTSGPDQLEFQSCYINKRNAELLYDEDAFTQNGGKNAGSNWSRARPLSFQLGTSASWPGWTTEGIRSFLGPETGNASGDIRSFYLTTKDLGTGTDCIWKVALSPTGLVRVSKYPESAVQPTLTLRFDKMLGTWTGSYVSQLSRLRCNLYGVIGWPSDEKFRSGAGWAETGVLPWTRTEAWRLEINPP